MTSERADTKSGITTNTNPAMAANWGHDRSIKVVRSCSANQSTICPRMPNNIASETAISAVNNAISASHGSKPRV